APTITTHVIDPDIDEARVYLLQDMIYSLSLVAFGHCKGVDAASRTEPRHNLGVDPYYTDGLRVVLIFGSDSIPIDEIKNLGWESLAPR
ncbi:MAG: LssY C-terminal domain-containing protein, partial [Planctomycetota bacterium]|nr:LssY C-terminal domain-containing protein [Planctomycetota bacterium]